MSLNKIFYYSLKTDDREYCFELLLDGNLHFAKYDLNKNLIGKKIKMGLYGAAERIKSIEKMTGKKFIKEYI